MKCTAMVRVLAATAVALTPWPSAAASVMGGVTPVQKVIQLMEGMKQKGQDEKHKEQVMFSQYKQFCEDTNVQKQRDIAKASEKIEGLKADIEKHIATSERMGKEVAGHDSDIAAWTGDQKAATNVRAIEKSDYDALHQDYSESVDALTRAVAVVKKVQGKKAQQTAELIQVANLRKLALIPEDAKHVIEAFLQTVQKPEADVEASGSGAGTLDMKNKEAHGYESSSGGVVDMLEGLHEKFVQEKTDHEKDEMNSKHAHKLMMQDLDTQLGQAKKDRATKAERKAKALQAKADAEGDLVDTTTTRDSDEKYLSDLVATCEQKATDYETRQQLRTEELQAIDKAIEIISSSSVSGSADTYLPSSLAQTSRGTVLASLRSNSISINQNRMVDYLRMRAKQLDSRVLSTLVSRVAGDPFKKVKKMVKDLIVRLMEEANEEAEHKGWCDTELGTNANTRDQKTQAVETLTAEIDLLETSIAKLAEDLTELSKAVADLDKAMAEATTLRQEEKETNTKTIADAQEAQTAVAQALTVLKEFYAKAGESTALLQQPPRQPEAPEIFDSPYQGMQGENGGVVGMLEVIASDFARLEADTEAAEASAQKEYDTFMTDSKVDKASKEKSIEHKTAKSQNEAQTLTQKKSDLEGTQKELDAALDYFEKLKPSCVDAGVSFEDRTARRKEEIESLQEALRILNGEDMA